MTTLSREKVLEWIDGNKPRDFANEREVGWFDCCADLEKTINSGELDTLSDPALCLKIGTELAEIEEWIQRHSVFIVASEIRKLKAEAERLKNKYEPTPPRVEY